MSDAGGAAGAAGEPPPAILHVDLDAFFASVEQLLDPALRGRPVIVGGTGNRGVVAAASYEARAFGVHSALPTARARRLCPEGVFVSPRIGVYSEYSKQVFTVMRSFTPLVEPISLDEAFLDVRGAERLFGDGPRVARQIKDRVKEDAGLVCSVGVATTKLVAKLAGSASKPDGLLVVERGTELGFLHPLPVERLWGVGPATLAKLARLGVRTVGDLARVPEATLRAGLGKASAAHLRALAWNLDARGVTPEQTTKSVSAEETFSADLREAGRLRREARRLALRVGGRLRKAGWLGRTVTLKVRFADFRTITRSVTLARPTDSDRAVIDAAEDLLARIETKEGVRLLGVGVSNLERADARQGELALDGPDHRDIEAAVDEVRARFGADAVGPAALVDPTGLRTGRETDHSFGPDR